MTNDTDARPDILRCAATRHATKAFDATRKIPPDDVARIKELLRLSPSSTNMQPWHFILASTDEGKERIATSTDRLFPTNRDGIVNASHVVVFAGRLTVDDDYLEVVLDRGEADGRFDADKAAFRKGTRAGRRMFLDMNRREDGRATDWLARQVYLNIGQFLLGVEAMGIDARPMEGIDTVALDNEFGLSAKGFGSLVVVGLGYSDPNKDYNAALPKSRLPIEAILTEV